MAWAEEVLEREWGGRLQARRGELIDVLATDGLVAGDREGVLTYAVTGDELEIQWLVAIERNSGVGSALLDALPAMRAWVVTTNDNVDALRFYQRRGFRISAVRPGAVDEARATIKPSIGLVGEHGIEIHDEIELTRAG